ncbi:unnamed protein product, partial [Polarella glacialis]
PEVQWWPEGQVEVQKAGQELLVQLEQVFTSRTWHDPGLDSKGNKKLLKAELDSLLSGWQQRQLADGENVDDATADLIRGMADSFKSVMRSHNGIPKDFKELRPVLEEAWRKRLAEQATQAVTAREPQPEVQWWPEGQVELQKAGQDLLADLEHLFVSRTWQDASLAAKGNKQFLEVQLDSVILGWQQRRMATGGEDFDCITASLLLAETAKDEVLGQQGIPKDFKELRPVLEEAWRKRLAEQPQQQQQATPVIQPEVRWCPEGQVGVQKAGQELMVELEQMFESHTWHDAGLDAEGNKQLLEVELDNMLNGWQERQLATGENVDDITSSLLRSMAEVAKENALLISSSQGFPPKDFRQLRAVLEEAWRQRLVELAAQPACDFLDVQWWPAKGPKELQQAGESLLNDLRGMVDSRRTTGGETRSPILQAELAHLLDGWREHKLMTTIDVENMTDALLRSLATEAEDVLLAHEAAGKLDADTGRLMAEIREAWRMRLAVVESPESPRNDKKPKKEKKEKKTKTRGSAGEAAGSAGRELNQGMPNIGEAAEGLLGDGVSAGGFRKKKPKVQLEVDLNWRPPKAQGPGNYGEEAAQGFSGLESDVMPSVDFARKKVEDSDKSFRAPKAQGPAISGEEAANMLLFDAPLPNASRDATRLTSSGASRKPVFKVDDRSKVTDGPQHSPGSSRNPSPEPDEAVRK